MSTWKRLLNLVNLGIFFLAIGCAKKDCKKPLDSTPKSVTSLEWRLVSSTDPETKQSLSKFTFLVFKFEVGFSGLIKKAKNNVLQEDQQAKPFVYATDSLGGKFLCIEYLDDQAAKEERIKSGNLENLCGEESENLFYYSYQLDRWGLKIQDVDTGETYQFCPFEGAYAPDDTSSP